jgi:pre-mRNA-processing factor 8
VTYVFPLNLLKKFVEISDPYVQICAMVYGKVEEDVIEVQCFVIPPQTGTYERVDFVNFGPGHDALDGLVVIGWIHTTALDERSMPPQDAITCAVMADWTDPGIFANFAISYIPGACSLRGYHLEAPGLEWALQNKEMRDRPIGWDDEFYRQVPLLITETYQGWFMVPSGVDWNLNFRSLQLGELKTFEVELGIPRPFFDQRFRANHFLQFISDTEGEDHGSVDVEDRFQ